MVKKLFVFAVIGLVSLPVQAVEARQTSAVQHIIDNVANAESIDLSIDIDVTTANERLARPLVMHLDLDGAADVTRERGQLEYNFWSTDADGEVSEQDGSVVLTSEKTYISGAEDVWYFLENTTANTLEDVAGAGENINEFTVVMQELLRQGVITYTSEGADVIRRTKTVRYAYEVNNDRLVDYLVDKNAIDADEAEETRETIENLTIDGYMWIDTSEMVPVLMTASLDYRESATMYTTVDVTVLFNSINEPVTITVPKNAVSMQEYFAEYQDDTEDMMTSVETAIDNMDTDGDGLLNADEESTWDTSTLRADTDGDGYSDYTEVVNGYDPNGKGKLDSDGDGLTDYNELTIHWTNRFDTDSDNDGFNDGVEIANGYNPNGLGRW